VTVFFYLFTLFLSLFLQIFLRNLLSNFAPNFLLLLVVYIALAQGVIAGIFFGFTLGLLSDIFSLNPFGSQAFLFTLVGYLAGRQNGKIDADQPLAQVILVFLTSFVYLFGLYLFTSFFSVPEKKFNLFPQILMNIFFTVPFFWFFRYWFKLWRQK